MFDMTTMELLKTIYVALSASVLTAGGIIVWFLIQGERIHKLEEE